MAFLEPISARRTAAGQTGRLYRSCPGQDFGRRLVCRSAWTIGALRLSRMALAEIITKPAPAIGIFPLCSGRKFRSPISAARNSSELVEDGVPVRLDGRP